MNVVLIATYELGHQPFGLASPAAWLAEAGASVQCLDLSAQPMAPEVIRGACLVAFHVPMHTAARIAVPAVARVRALNPHAHLCFYGVYAPLNEAFWRELGASTILGGEYEQALVALYRRLAADEAGPALECQPEPLIWLVRQQFRVPRRDGLPDLLQYAKLCLPEGSWRTAGYTEASRGCKHNCRHCPIVVVYGGRLRIVQRDVVLEDIRQQVGAGATHITFGDPDFFNAPEHALAIVRRLHAEFPDLTYDVTVKIEHLLQQHRRLAELRDTGCLFITSAVESIDDRILQILNKGHTHADFQKALRLVRDAGLTLEPTFVAFTPWTSLEGYCELLACLREQSLIENVAPIQLGIRLLIPAGSQLLDLPEMHGAIREYDPATLAYRWSHPDPRVDELAAQVLKLVRAAKARGLSRHATFEAIAGLAYATAGLQDRSADQDGAQPAAQPVPYLSEDWYC